ncbi:MAG TPA: zinc ribbon domain-containing protein [Symbiobacteriaceae bacterium]|jgi:hypothetical protein
MLKQFLPKDPILKRALAGLVLFVLGMGLARGFAAWDGVVSGRIDPGRKHLSEAVWQYGPKSQEVKDVISQMGAAAPAGSIIALLDPATGEAMVAVPAAMTGKKPEEMTLPGDVKVPALPMLQAKGSFSLRPFKEGSIGHVDVWTQAIYPWMDERELRGHEGMSFGPGVVRRDRGFDQGWDGPGQLHRRQMPNPWVQAPDMPAPLAVLLIATPPRTVSALLVLAGVSGAVGMAGFALYWLSVAWWVFADARRHGSRAFAWGVLALLTNVVGAVVYLIVRKERVNCPACGVPVERSFSHCPQCGQQLKYACAQCGTPMKDGWQYCAKCGQPRTEAGQE